MDSGAFLEQAGHGATPYRVIALLHEGRHYQVALAERTGPAPMQACVKVIAWEPGMEGDVAVRRTRREALRAEFEALSQGFGLLPSDAEWLALAGAEPGAPEEPALAYRHVPGTGLLAWMDEHHPRGMPAAKALAMWAGLAAKVEAMHQARWVVRRLDPRDLVVGSDGELHLVAFDSVTPMGKAPRGLQAEEPVEGGEEPWSGNAYVAPEARQEQSGQFLRRAADVYALGALLSYLLTGEEPRGRVESPLTKESFDRLSAMDPPGVSLLVARCLQPLAKKRFGTVSKLLVHADMERLPTPQTEGFGLVLLPGPWTGADLSANRALQSKLSAGPLLSVAPTADDAPGQAQRPETDEHLPVSSASEVAEEPSRRGRVPWGMVVWLVVLGFLILSAWLQYSERSA